MRIGKKNPSLWVMIAIIVHTIKLQDQALRSNVSRVFLEYTRMEKLQTQGLAELCLGNNYDFDTLMDNIFKLSDLKVDPWSLPVLTPTPSPVNTRGLFGSSTISEEEFNKSKSTLSPQAQPLASHNNTHSSQLSSDKPALHVEPRLIQN